MSESAAAGVAGEIGTAGAEGGYPARVTGRSVMDLLLGVPYFVRLLLGLLTDRRVSLLDRLLFGAAVALLLVPRHRIPKWMPVAGRMDDLLIIALALYRLLHRTDPGVLDEHWHGEDEPLVALHELLERVAEALPAWARAVMKAG